MSGGENRRNVNRVAAATGKKKFNIPFLDRLSGSDGKPDYIFLIIISALVIYGLMMLFSAGSARAYALYGNVFYFLIRQGRWVLLGAVFMVFLAYYDYHKLTGKLAASIYIGTAVLLILVVAGLGRTVNGATRWLWFFQPSEFAKIAIIITISGKLGTVTGQNSLKSFKEGFGPNLVVLVIYLILLYFEPHYSCMILITVISMLLLFVGGAKLKHFIPIVIVGILALGYMALNEGYRMDRIATFFGDPFADAQGDGYQIVQSLYAIGSGGIFGVGLGQSRQKFQALPEPQNDFIFSVLCEELGLIGATILILLFMALLIRGIQIAVKAPDLFGTLLVVGIVGMITLQALVNIAVVTKTMPVTGMPLPFFSYGGTALCITMAEMGIVLNVSRQIKTPL